MISDGFTVVSAACPCAVTSSKAKPNDRQPTFIREGMDIGHRCKALTLLPSVVGQGVAFGGEKGGKRISGFHVEGDVVWVKKKNQILLLFGEP